MLEKEEIKGYILADKFSWKPNIHFALFFTLKRLIVAKVGALFKDFVASAEYAKKAEELKEVSIESILKADKDNFEIPYTDITDIEIKKAGWKDKLVADFVTIGTLTIKIKDKKGQKFNITKLRIDPSAPSKVKPQKLEDCINVVRSVLSDKLSVKS
jgi:type IV secretory pathway TrbF-like protein